MTSASASEFVVVDRPGDGVARITLNRPERMNSMAFDVMLPLRDVLRDIGDHNDVRAVILTGAGRGFSSGGHRLSSLYRPANVSKQG